VKRLPLLLFQLSPEKEKIIALCYNAQGEPSTNIFAFLSENYSPPSWSAVQHFLQATLTVLNVFPSERG
jgi:hypothetical protein